MFEQCGNKNGKNDKKSKAMVLTMCSPNLAFMAPPKSTAEKKMAALNNMKELINKMEQEFRVEAEPQVQGMCGNPPCCSPCCQPGCNYAAEKKSDEPCRPPDVMVCYKIPGGKKKKKSKKTEPDVIRVKKSQSRELRSSQLYVGCDCERRNGLQDDCPRTDCKGSPECITHPPTCGPSEYAGAKHLIAKGDAYNRRKNGLVEEEEDDGYVEEEYQCFPAYIKDAGPAGKHECPALQIECPKECGSSRPPCKTNICPEKTPKAILDYPMFTIKESKNKSPKQECERPKSSCARLATPQARSCSVQARCGSAYKEVGEKACPNRLNSKSKDSPKRCEDWFRCPNWQEKGPDKKYRKPEQHCCYSAKPEQRIKCEGPERPPLCQDHPGEFQARNSNRSGCCGNKILSPRRQASPMDFMKPNPLYRSCPPDLTESFEGLENIFKALKCRYVCPLDESCCTDPDRKFDWDCHIPFPPFTKAKRQQRKEASILFYVPLFNKPDRCNGLQDVRG